MKALGIVAFLMSIVVVLAYISKKEHENDPTLQEVFNEIDKISKEWESERPLRERELARSCYETALLTWNAACTRDPVFMYCSLEENVLGSGCTSRAKYKVEQAKGDRLYEKRRAFCEEIKPGPEYFRCGYHE